MIEVKCFTNLALIPSESWPTTLPCRPVVGDFIESKFQHPQYALDSNGFPNGSLTHFCGLELQVCAIRFKRAKVTYNVVEPNYFVEVELTVPSRFKSLTEFYTYYSKLTGQPLSSFI